MKESIDIERIDDWISRCLPSAAVQTCQISNVGNGKEREVWECRCMVDGVHTEAILTLFKPGDLQSVNTSLPPREVATKCALAMAELPVLGIPTPRMLGQEINTVEAALLCEKIKREEWTPNMRIKAARILAMIHDLDGSCLSDELQRLTKESDPREYRTTGGLSPQPQVKTLVHGDYFSKNILTANGGLCVIDWETFGWGDPMWDLGFLIGADRDLPEDEVESVVAEYEKYLPVDWEHLMWHKQRWSDFWEKRTKQLANKALHRTPTSGISA